MEKIASTRPENSFFFFDTLKPGSLLAVRSACPKSLAEFASADAKN